MNNRKTLLHIGYPKTGATFLWQYFSSHPMLTATGSLFDDYINTGEIEPGKIAVPQSERPLVVSEERLSVWGGDYDIVGVHFKPNDIKSHQLKTCGSLKKMFPDAEVLIITRGFESALRSMYWQYVSIGGIYTFKDFQDKYAAYLADFYDYAFLVRAYRSAFGKVVLLPYELLNEDAGNFLVTLEQHCGLPHHAFDIQKANASAPEKIASYRMLSASLYQTIRPLPYSWKKNIYGLYVYALYQNKLKLFSDIFKVKTDLQVSEQTLSLFHGKADLLRNEPLYQPYLSSYLPA